MKIYGLLNGNFVYSFDRHALDLLEKMLVLDPAQVYLVSSKVTCEMNSWFLIMVIVLMLDCVYCHGGSRDVVYMKCDCDVFLFHFLDVFTSVVMVRY